VRAGRGHGRDAADSGHRDAVAGTGTVGFSGDAGPATAAPIVNGDVAVDASGNLLILAAAPNSGIDVSDTGGQRIRLIGR